MNGVATIPFLEIEIADLPLDEAVAAVMAGAGDGTFSYVVTPNVDHVVALRREPPDARSDAFAAAYADADLILCDSRVLARLAALSGQRLPVVPGSDLTAALFERGLLDGRTVAIVGGGEELVAKLAARFPAVSYRQHRPPMGVLGDPTAQAAIVDFVAKQQADVTMFAIGAPQGEWAARACKASGRARGVGLCIGASLEFLTGDKGRAPVWMRRAGIEWSHRLLTEPRRLWRRYLVEGPRIFAIWWRERKG